MLHHSVGYAGFVGGSVSRAKKKKEKEEKEEGHLGAEVGEVVGDLAPHPSVD